MDTMYLDWPGGDKQPGGHTLLAKKGISVYQAIPDCCGNRLGDYGILRISLMDEFDYSTNKSSL